LLGKEHTSFYHSKRMVKDSGHGKLTITFMPVGTRWLYECKAAAYAVDNAVSLRWLHEEVGDALSTHTHTERETETHTDIHITHTHTYTPDTRTVDKNGSVDHGTAMEPGDVLFQ
jgi:hypothetical protein